MNPALKRTAIEVFAGIRCNTNDAAVFNIVVDRVGNHVFLVEGTEIVFIKASRPCGR